MKKLDAMEYIFTWNIGDHLPIHIHVYKDGKLICRWMLVDHIELSGKANKKIIETILELKKEGKFRTLKRLIHENSKRFD